jgi:hypothetical protein
MRMAKFGEMFVRTTPWKWHTEDLIQYSKLVLARDSTCEGPHDAYITCIASILWGAPRGRARPGPSSR